MTKFLFRISLHILRFRTFCIFFMFFMLYCLKKSFSSPQFYDFLQVRPIRLYLVCIVTQFRLNINIPLCSPSRYRISLSNSVNVNHSSKASASIILFLPQQNYLLFERKLFIWLEITVWMKKQQNRNLHRKKKSSWKKGREGFRAWALK